MYWWPVLQKRTGLLIVLTIISQPITTRFSMVKKHCNLSLVLEKKHTKTISVEGTEITILQIDDTDYICITDIAKAKSNSARAADVVRNWLRNRGTLEYLSVWEQIYNPEFKVFESEHFKKQAVLLRFTPSIPKWVQKTNAVSLYVKRGKADKNDRNL